MLEDWQGVHTPGILYECKNKGLTKLAFRKLLILNGAFSVDGSKWEDTGEKKNGTTASAGAGVNAAFQRDVYLVSIIIDRKE